LFLGIAVLIQRSANDSGIVAMENGPLMQRGCAMLFLYLTPWVVFRVCMASPLPEVFPDPRSKSAQKVLEPDPLKAVRRPPRPFSPAVNSSSQPDRPAA